MNEYKITLVDAGDSAVSMRFPQEISEKVHNEVIYYLDAIKSAVLDGRLSGILDIIPSYAAILLCFDPLITDGEEVKNALEKIISSTTSSVHNEIKKNIVEIPVVYGDEFGPDLETVSSHTGLSPKDVIRLHSEREYPVYMIGFLAGFPYLGGMNPSIATPRLASPRLSVPSGSIGIADGQTGIYSVESPGGWQIIGRTPLRLYDPYSDNPFLISTGDYIRFVPIESAEFPEDIDTHFSTKSAEEPSLRILSPGPLTTIQDCGRHGYMDRGISVSGAMDALELSILNLLLGNPPDAAGIESTIMTPRIEFLKDTVFTMSGITSPIIAKAGEILEPFTMPHGARTYLAFSGGIDSNMVLGSRATDIRNGIGGIACGKKLNAGDELPLVDIQKSISSSDNNISSESSDYTHRMELETIPLSSVDFSHVSAALLEKPYGPITLYVTSGPQYSDISKNAMRTFFDSEYTVSTASDRMGIRFDGPSLTFNEGKDGNIITDGVSPGAIQITPSGQPILMNVDAQTTGGYAKPLWLASVSKRKVAQLRPGDKVNFILIKTSDAVSLFREEVSAMLSV